MTTRTYPQHPLAKIRHPVPWGTWLGEATISDVEWIAPGLTVAGEDWDDETGETFALISGVTEGETFPITVRMAASDGRQKDSTFNLIGQVDVLHTFNKDPDDEMNVGINYGYYLDALTISASDWDVPAGLDTTGDIINGDFAVVGLTGGSERTRYRLTNLADLSNGERLAGVVDVYVKEG